ncbi:uncharacterized protein LOC117171153 [Belonocnema kinseyi]|uniref:uncharacterized protein LOC117171153 n=1 Tax=Belonocnema kinseyi TaxID=2817044 RepID=UPI00143DE489|nr:uncharacterized protein LOC117171153 [Belonocnema kinseyi]
MTAPGPNGEYPVFLQRAGKIIIKPIVRLARAILTLGYVSAAWRGATVAFIPKAGRIVYTSPKDFRPISLTSFLLKTVERIVDRYICDKILSSSPLHKQKHVYGAGHSIKTALSTAVNLIQRQVKQKGIALETFRDID